MKSHRYRGIFLFLFGALVAYLLLIYDFLSVTQPVNGEALVVEAWFPDQQAAVRDAAERVKRGNYRLVVCVAVDNSPASNSVAIPDAELTAQQLIALGVERSRIRTLPLSKIWHDRTYTCAVEARELLRREMPGLRSIDVFTVSVHARKSWMLYKKAFPEDVAVGIIAGKGYSYPLSQWWLSLRGIYVTVRNTFGYLYALGFSPDREIPTSR